MKNLPGLYLHVPFCAGGKCPYCDFYSLPFEEGLARRYLRAAGKQIGEWGRRAAGREFGSVYFGGGTPSLLGKGLAALLEKIKGTFSLAPDAEITFEANPSGKLGPLFPPLRKAGFNRVSLGMQSADPGELNRLGRRHAPEDIRQAAAAALDAGFRNISLDLMLGTPGETLRSAAASVEFAAATPGVTHISAYLLKLEPATPFGRRPPAGLPGEEEQRALYLSVCARLEKEGFRQYEISNFARGGFASRHNLNYWRDGEYIGIGPAAHSFWDGQRLHFPRDLDAFLSGKPPESDGPGGGFEETVMLGLRLTEGLSEAALKRRCGKGFEALNAAVLARCEKEGIVIRRDGHLALTREGFLVSNAVIGGLLF